jgi:hypothetical protein
MATMRSEPYADPTHHDMADAKTVEKGNANASANGNGKEPDAESIRFDQALRVVRAIPEQLTVQVKNNPGTTLAAVGAVSFVAGAIFGSRIGRVAVTAAIGWGIKTMIDRGILEQIGKQAFGQLSAKLAK